MRQLVFNEPNYSVEVERAGARSTRIEYAPTEAALRKWLEDRQYTIISIAPYKFREWRTLAAARRKKFSPATKPYVFDAEIWTAVKQYLYSLSNDLCGYCETKVFPGNYGAVEHYRPKSAVSDDPKHPGYYWLAYDIENYVPTCQKCNTGKGKKNQFPIKGKRAGSPKASLASEKPLLLHPFRGNPAKHLKFLAASKDAKFAEGFIAGVDAIGKTSVEVYQLNREDLAVDRQKAIDSVRLLLNSSAQNPEQRGRLIAEIAEGRREYASTCMAVLTAWLDEQQATIDRERQLLAGKQRRSK